MWFWLFARKLFWISVLKTPQLMLHFLRTHYSAENSHFWRGQDSKQTSAILLQVYCKTVWIAMLNAQVSSYKNLLRYRRNTTHNSIWWKKNLQVDLKRTPGLLEYIRLKLGPLRCHGQNWVFRPFLKTSLPHFGSEDSLLAVI